MGRRLPNYKIGVPIFRRLSRNAWVAGIGSSLVASIVFTSVILPRITTDSQREQDAGRLASAPSVASMPSDRVCKSEVAAGPTESLSVDIVVRDDDGCFKQMIATIQTGGRKLLALRYANTSSRDQRGVVVGVILPEGMQLVPNSTELSSGHTKGWESLETNALASNKVNIGGYLPGGIAYVRFEVTVPFRADIGCGLTDLAVMAVARVEGHVNASDTSNVSLVKAC